ncbi:unnamed protein product [Pieris macdunnoughi]|uniref:C2H2-type domain-containing protein n=2 Tax=Pieris macdunnoughi TaxID=345717 RepID=A0A821XC33_9NEOP|nr:unnamed protein product [Pieris macdunnoughi]
MDNHYLKNNINSISSPEDSPTPRTSIWQMTVYERLNAASFLENTTAKPFYYYQANFKCFFCSEIFTEVTSVLQHTDSHPMTDRSSLLRNYLRKGKRVIKVDISNLKCRICDEKYSDIDEIRKHLAGVHNREFNSAGNGVIAYDLRVNNGLLSCHKCNKTFNSFFLLNRHMNVHFSVVCETCGLGFMSHHRLISHRIVHQNGVHRCDNCEEVFATKLKLRYHMFKKHEMNTKRRKPLKCPHCLERFAEHYRKMTHLKEVHGITFTFDCQSCKAVFPTRRALTEHTTKQHTQKIQCKVCGKCFGTQSLLKMHSRGHTGERNFSCGICQKSYMHERTLRQHMRVHGPVWKFTCSECGHGFHNRNDFNKHMKQWHPQTVKNFVPEFEGPKPSTSDADTQLIERLNAATIIENTTVKPFIYLQANFKCFYCSEVFPEVSSVLQHSNYHTLPDRPSLLKNDYLKQGKRVIRVDISDLKCRLCDHKLNELEDVRQHLETEHHKEFKAAGDGLMAYDLTANNGLIACYKCKETFTSFHLLNRHMNAHSSFVCETCGVGFVSQRRLINHTIVHQNGTHKCKQCDEVFPTKLKLRYHVITKHNKTDKRIRRKCPHCLERFTEHYRKMTHLREAHGITFSFDCRFCSEVFPTRKALTKHTTQHHTQKIQCTICGKCFGTNTLLKRHMRGHIGERNFVCDICQKAYMHEKSLRQHMHVHGPLF